MKKGILQTGGSRSGTWIISLPPGSPVYWITLTNGDFTLILSAGLKWRKRNKPFVKTKSKDMKKFLPLIGFSLFAVACNQSPKVASETTAVPVPVPASTVDTTGLAAYHAWKAQHELVEEAAPYVQTVSSTPTHRTSSPARKVSRTPVRKSTPRPAATPSPATESNTGSGQSNDDVAANGTGGTGTSASSGEAKAEEKKGMSKATKGAIIGGAGGAVAGAVLNKKNRVAGAVIGGVIGAGGGYVIGRQMDKKDASN